MTDRADRKFFLKRFVQNGGGAIRKAGEFCRKTCNKAVRIVLRRETKNNGKQAESSTAPQVPEQPTLQPDQEALRNQSIVDSLRVGNRIPVDADDILKRISCLPNDKDRLLEFLSGISIAHLANYMVWIPYEKFYGLGKLGEGAFSIVYKAKVNCGKEEKVVALKKMKQTGQDQLRNEIELSMTLQFNHLRRPATPRLLGLSMDDGTGRYILVMEYASGGNLEKRLADDPPSSWYCVWKIAVGIARRLQVLHEVGLIHNDLHPGNIMFVGDNPILIDVGISATVENFRSHGDSAYGPVAYRPPETFVNARTQHTQKSDIHCLGTLFWQLTARFPPRNDATSPPSDAANLGLREFPIPGTPAAFADVYKKCWNPNPDERPTVDEVLRELEAMELDLAEAKWLGEVPEAGEYLMRFKNLSATDISTMTSANTNRFLQNDPSTN